jgi:hypothetical protein
MIWRNAASWCSKMHQKISFHSIAAPTIAGMSAVVRWVFGRDTGDFPLRMDLAEDLRRAGYTVTGGH